MADDTVQSGTDTIATDHVTTLNGVAVTQSATSPKVQRVKATFGDDGTARDVSAAFPLPVVAGAGTNIIGSVREPHDTARVAVSLIVEPIPAVATEALFSYAGFNGATALTAGTAAFTVPAGRVFRIQSIQLAMRGSAADTVRARVRSAATVAATSPHAASLAAAIGGAGGASADVEPSREIEIAASQQIGISAVGATSSNFTMSVIGYTYVP